MAKKTAKETPVVAPVVAQVNTPEEHIAKLREGRTKYNSAVLPCDTCREPVEVTSVTCGKCLAKDSSKETITIRKAAQALDNLIGIGVGDCINILVAYLRGDSQPLENLKVVRTCPSCGRTYMAAETASKKEK